MDYPRAGFAVLLVIFLAGCSLPFSPTTAPIIPTFTATPTATISSTPTPAPTPTLIPTPLPLTRLSSGDQAFWNGDNDLALEEYQQAQANSGDPEISAAAMLGIGRIRYSKGEYDISLDAFRKLVDAYPNTASGTRASFWLGQTYTRLKRYAEAAEAYTDYLAKLPGKIDSFVQELLGDAFMAAGEPAKAIDAYQAAILASHLGDSANLEIKLGQDYTSTGNYASAIDAYNQAYTGTDNSLIKAEADLYAGQAYLALGDGNSARDRYMDAVVNYPRTYSAYASLVDMVDNGLEVSDYYRGVVDYYAEQYSAALIALNRFTDTHPDHDGSALHYKALSLAAIQDYSSAILVWDIFTQNYPDNPLVADAWEEKAYLQWTELDQPSEAAQTLLDFVASAPTNPRAPGALYDAGRNYERAGELEEAAITWERLGNEYPAAAETFRGLFFAGIARYRNQQYEEALADFQRDMLLTADPIDQSAAYLWIGKSQAVLGRSAEAQAAWQQAAGRDPTGYYSERAKELISGRAPFSHTSTIDLAVDMTSEKNQAEAWLRNQFQIPPDTSLEGIDKISSDSRFIRGEEFWKLGLMEKARDEYEDLRQSINHDPIGTYQLVNHLLDMGLFRSVILGARQILSMAGMDDAATLTAPAYFNHLRFGTYYKDLVLPEAQADDLDPLFIFSLMRQESLFEGFNESSAGARGLMQIMPATGQGIASNLNWPPGYTEDDLYRPMVSVRLGVHYLSQQRDYFDGDLYAALAAYNGGPGNTIAWQELSNGDPDLFLEIVRLEETRTYIMRIYEMYTIYRALYSHEGVG